MRGFESKHWGWWYLSIALGFILLALVNLLRGGHAYGAAIRIVIAIGFSLLGWMQFRYGR